MKKKKSNTWETFLPLLITLPSLRSPWNPLWGPWHPGCFNLKQSDEFQDASIQKSTDSILDLDSSSQDISKATEMKEMHVHGKRSEVILFVFNMYLQQGGHRQKRLTTWWKLKQKQKKKNYINYQCSFPTFFIQ